MDEHEQTPGLGTKGMASPADGTAGMINSVERDLLREQTAPDERAVAAGNPADPTAARLDWIDPDALEALKRRRQHDLAAARAGMEMPAWATASPLPAEGAPVDDGGKPRAAPTGDAQAESDRPEGKPPDGARPTASPSKTEPLATPPESVSKRYLQAGSRYFLRDGSREIAFEDRGMRMVTAHNRPDIAESMAEMALAKGWTHIHVKGHEDFRRAVWLEAAVRGIGVTGYAPTEQDRASLAELMQTRMTNRVEQMGMTGVPAVATVSEPVPAKETAPQSPADRRQPDAKLDALPLATVMISSTAWAPESEFRGELVAHGRAPYQNRAGAQVTYFATLREASGNQLTVWGAGLERAIAESGAQAGEQVHLANYGRRRVAAEVPAVDARGGVTGTEWRTIERYVWRANVEPRDRQPTAGAGPDDSLRLLHMSVIAEAMRAQGFSEKSVVKVQMRAGEVMDRLQAQGVQVPAPRLFDPHGRVQQPRSRGNPVAPSTAPDVERVLQPAAPAVPSR
ncbi:LPD7 domain-containing protein [Burkholderia multivorans]|uniref:LPD7 domain-containing protein n=1 Tax=Burkholderia multivorans TaxID=87883 RepID=UPI000B2A42FD|nr:LPD7 domain-containing protein [Burkholderia multivorans]